MKEEVGKLEFIKTKNLCFMKDTVKRVKRQVPDGKNIFAKHVSDKGLVPKICKEDFKQTTQFKNK